LAKLRKAKLLPSLNSKKALMSVGIATDTHCVMPVQSKQFYLERLYLEHLMNFQFWFMLPISIAVATTAMASGTEGATFLRRTSLFLL
jgi:hypothetical protein